mgnify:CR=1 FL=1
MLSVQIRGINRNRDNLWEPLKTAHLRRCQQTRNPLDGVGELYEPYTILCRFFGHVSINTLRLLACWRLASGHFLEVPKTRSY